MNDLQHWRNNVIAILSALTKIARRDEKIYNHFVSMGKEEKNVSSEEIFTHCFLVLNRRGFFMSRAGWVDRGHSLINKNVQCRSQYYIGSDSQVLTCGLSPTTLCSSTWVSLQQWAFFSMQWNKGCTLGSKTKIRICFITFLPGH